MAVFEWRGRPAQRRPADRGKFMFNASVQRRMPANAGRQGGAARPKLFGRPGCAVLICFREALGR